MNEVSTLGAVCALSITIILILIKIPVFYSMLSGALLGGLFGGANLPTAISLMTEGAQGMIPAVLRILAAGVLAGVLLESGAANRIAAAIIQSMGNQRALLALILATMTLTAVGVFVDIAVITVAPIGLAVARDTNLSRTAMLLAMVGGGKCGNIISPNPNTIAAAEAFQLPLPSVMAAGIIPAFFGIVITYYITGMLRHKGSRVRKADVQVINHSPLPKTFAAITAPLTAIILLSLRPIAGITIDPLLALPAGGIAGAVAMGHLTRFNTYTISGVKKMSGVAIMLIGTGTLAGIVEHSDLKTVLTTTLQSSSLPSYMLAPVSGAFMSAATASTTAGTIVASNIFSSPILELGVAAIGGAAMIHAGATVFDSMPHGSFFHSTGGATGMGIKERLAVLPYECAVGFSLAFISTLIFGVFKLFQ